MKTKLRPCLAAALACALALGAPGLALAAGVPIPRGAAVVIKARAPKKIAIAPIVSKMEKGDALQLFATVSPAGANPAIRWSSSNRKIATVDQNGLVTAVKTGKVRIRAASKGKPSVYKKLHIKVVDTKTVTGVVIENDGGALLVGTSLALSARVLPPTASQQVTWFSEGAADVSEAGVVTGKQLGSAIITAVAGGKRASQRVVVLDAQPVSAQPAQITPPNPDAIRLNLGKIGAVEDCALEEIDRLFRSKAIGESEKKTRRNAIENAFRMAAFPWMSKRPVKYWSGNYRYLANAVYFGIPYTQTNRSFDDRKILNSKLFRKLPGEEYYTATLKDKSYPGNDCSSFVSMSIWGRGSSHSFLRSRNILKESKSSPYRTIATRANASGYQKLRPGDLFVRNGHVAMFLYFTDSCRSRVMIIQQGGLKALNTVACTVKPLSYYSGDKGYVARRRKSYAA